MNFFKLLNFPYFYETGNYFIDFIGQSEHAGLQLNTISFFFHLPQEKVSSFAKPTCSFYKTFNCSFLISSFS